MKKEIVIKAGVVENLSFEEVLERMKGVLCTKIKKYFWTVQQRKFEKDDLEQEMMIALWEAYNMFDANKKYTLGTYFDKRSADKIYRKTRALNMQMRSNMVETSINVQINDGDSGRFTEMQDMLEDGQANTDKDVIDRMTARQLKQDIVDSLTDKQKEIFKYMSTGMKDIRTSEKLNLGRSAIYRYRKDIQKRALKVINSEKWSGICEL